MIRLLVLHGPHHDRLGKGKLSSEPTLASLNGALDFAASAAGAQLKVAQADTEPDLCRALEAASGWATHVLLSPGALAPTAWVLRQSLALLGAPFAEVYLEALPDAGEHKKRSVLRDAGQFQRAGAVTEVYFEAAQELTGARFAKVPVELVRKAGLEKAVVSEPARAAPQPEPAKKTLGPKPRAEASAAPAQPAAPARKTLGRPRNEATAKAEPAGPAPKTLGKARRTTEPESARGVTRAQVRQRIAERLGGRISTAELATWGREQWLAVERGGPTESGQRELLAEALQSLALAGTLSEPELLDLMARMG